MVPREVIERIKDEVDIVQVISEYVNLQRVGANYRGLCPFHTETTPSFYVSPAKKIYHCFGCGVSGDVIKFVQEIERISYVEAIKKLAERVGIELHYSAEDSLKSKYIEFYRDLHARYRAQLAKSENIVRYLKNRGLDEREISLYEFGYSPPGSKLPQEVAKALSLSPEVLEEFGFHYGDPFAGRITIPIRDEYGRVVAFGGRLVGDGVPKYINSQDTPFFKKSATLFMLDVAKDFAKQLDYVVICEGYFDAIAFHRAGLKNAVATLGTALTKAHADRLKKYTSNVVIAYDSDKPGVAAAMRNLEVLIPLGFNVMIAQFSTGKDADEVFRKSGKDGLVEVLENAVSPDRFVAEELAKSVDLSNPNGFNTYVGALRKWAQLFEQNPKLLDGLAQSASAVSGVPSSRMASLLREATPYGRQEGVPKTTPQLRSHTQIQLKPTVRQETESTVKPPTLEDYLVYIYFNYPEDFRKLDFTPDLLQGRARDFFVFAKDLNVSLDQLSKDMGSFVKSCLDKIEIEIDDELVKALQKELDMRRIDKRIKEIDDMIPKVGTSEEKKVLLKARIELVKQRERLKKGP